MPEAAAETKPAAPPEGKPPERPIRKTAVSPATIVVFIIILAIYTVVLVWVMERTASKGKNQGVEPGASDSLQQGGEQTARLRGGLCPRIEVTDVVLSVPHQAGGTSTQKLTINLSLHIDMDLKEPDKFKKAKDYEEVVKELEKEFTPARRENLVDRVKDFIITQLVQKDMTVYDLRSQKQSDWAKKIKERANEILEKQFHLDKEFQDKDENKHHFRPVVVEVSFTKWNWSPN
jgi:dihydroneopterin aldolase